jgi:hypothetical protein
MSCKYIGEEISSASVEGRYCSRQDCHLVGSGGLLAWSNAARAKSSALSSCDIEGTHRWVVVLKSERC